MTVQTQAVLAALLEADAEQYGLQIIRSSGLAAGTVYPILQRLRAAGWVTAYWEPEHQAQDEGRPARRYYELSAQGRARAAHVLNRTTSRRAHPARVLNIPTPAVEGS
jgi:PadR family transcriptional regulator, regulatory protein PadR